MASSTDYCNCVELPSNLCPCGDRCWGGITLTLTVSHTTTRGQRTTHRRSRVTYSCVTVLDGRRWSVALQPLAHTCRHWIAQAASHLSCRCRSSPSTISSTTLPPMPLRRPLSEPGTALFAHTSAHPLTHRIEQGSERCRAAAAAEQLPSLCSAPGKQAHVPLWHQPAPWHSSAHKRREQSSPSHPASHRQACSPGAPAGTHCPCAPQPVGPQPKRSHASPDQGTAHAHLPSAWQRPWPEHSTQPEGPHMRPPSALVEPGHERSSQPTPRQPLSHRQSA